MSLHARAWKAEFSPVASKNAGAPKRTVIEHVFQKNPSGFITGVRRFWRQVQSVGGGGIWIWIWIWFHRQTWRWADKVTGTAEAKSTLIKNSILGGCRSPDRLCGIIHLAQAATCRLSDRSRRLLITFGRRPESRGLVSPRQGEKLSGLSICRFGTGWKLAYRMFTSTWTGKRKEKKTASAQVNGSSHVFSVENNHVAKQQLGRKATVTEDCTETTAVPSSVLRKRHDEEQLTLSFLRGQDACKKQPVNSKQVHEAKTTERRSRKAGWCGLQQGWGRGWASARSAVRENEARFG